VQRDTFEELNQRQIDAAIKAKGPGTLEELFAAEDTWVVE
jgi:hypothetical protein